MFLIFNIINNINDIIIKKNSNYIEFIKLFQNYYLIYIGMKFYYITKII